MQPCYFWISVTFVLPSVCVIKGRVVLVIVKHIMDEMQCKTALTSYISRAELQRSPFPVH